MNFVEIILEKNVLVQDGSLETIIPKTKYEEHSNSFSKILLEDPDIIEEAYIKFFDSCADIITTCTHEANPINLKKWDMDDRTTRINRKAVRLAKRNAPKDVLIAGRCGPTGSVIYPYGKTEADDFFKCYKKQISALVDESIDMLFVDKIPDTTEAAIAIMASKKISDELPVLVGVKFEKIAKGYFTETGTHMNEALQGLIDAGADAIGASCGYSLDGMVEIIRELRNNTDLPIFIKPDAGVPLEMGYNPKYSDSPLQMAEKVKSLIKEDIFLIGGCCGVTPKHTYALKKAVELYSTEED